MKEKALAWLRKQMVNKMQSLFNAEKRPGVTQEELDNLREHIEVINYSIAELDAPNWISTNERLPKPYERVLFIVKQSQKVCVGTYRSDGANGAHYFMYGNRLESSLWWMPLPELPNVGGDDHE